ncbi:olfactory receptor 14A16-like [Hippopotamus amphibius kiboko]|uniref:olfactory receptor 14A16-like n=1 Tax=Hippopotamus amphibius kiboko TaxID=575201 RepID=UPI002594EF6E|nr:olfactory receptor 14A16-like [Hippopotamus amphibius kiboko]
MENFTSGSTFFLMGFSDIREIQILHAVLFLLIYLAALLGNLLIIALTSKDHCLHTPMYFFLKNLSFLDLGLISITVPKSIMNSLTNHNTISFLGCVSQVFFFFLLATTEVALLTVMSYDRYIAICHPLRYDIIMNHGACVQMAASSWLSGCLSAILHTASTFSTPMCGAPEVHQFFCDVPQLLSLACSYNIGELVVIGLSLVLDFGCFVFIDISYIHIFSTVLRISSREGRSKAFSTCLPHLVVVTLFLSSGFFAYLHPLPKSPSLLDLLISVFYTVVPPTMNPLIYSLRNKDMKMALRRLRINGYF